MPESNIGDTDYSEAPTTPLDHGKSRVIFTADVQLATVNYPRVVDVGPQEGASPPKAFKPSGDEDEKPKAPSSTATLNKWIGSLHINQVSAVYDAKS